MAKKRRTRSRRRRSRRLSGSAPVTRYVARRARGVYKSHGSDIRLGLSTIGLALADNFLFGTTAADGTKKGLLTFIDVNKNPILKNLALVALVKGARRFVNLPIEAEQAAVVMSALAVAKHLGTATGANWLTDTLGGNGTRYSGLGSDYMVDQNGNLYRKPSAQIAAPMAGLGAAPTFDEAVQYR